MLYVDQTTEEFIAWFKADLATCTVTKSGKQKNLSKARINNILAPLRYVLKIYHRRKSDNPALNVSTMKEEAPDIDPLSPDELDKVLSAMKPHHNALFTSLAWTGARPDELFALRWKDVQFDHKEIHITKKRARNRGHSENQI